MIQDFDAMSDREQARWSHIIGASRLGEWTDAALAICSLPGSRVQDGSPADLCRREIERRKALDT